MNLTTIGSYVVHTKTTPHITTTPATQGGGATVALPTVAYAAAAASAAASIPPTVLHVSVHQPTGQRCLLQVLERRDPKDGSALAREVKAQMLAQSLPDSSRILRLREVLQDRENHPQNQEGSGALGASSSSYSGGRGLKRKATGDAAVDHARNSAAAAALLPPAVHRYYLMFEGFRDGEACDLLDFTKLLGKVPEEVARSLFAQLLETVASLHDLGIIHGDLKLPNVLVVREPGSQALKIKVKDFRYSTILTTPAVAPVPATAAGGAGRPVSGDTAHGATGGVRPPPGTVVTEKGELLVTTHKGSPAYLAPEVTYLNQPFDGKRADTYSLGVILYTMLFGCYPITAHSLTDLFELVRKGDIAFPREAGLSAEAVDLAKRLLDKDPAARMTLSEALAHPWLAAGKANAEPLGEEQLVPFAACAVAAAEAKKKLKVEPHDATQTKIPATSVC